MSEDQHRTGFETFTGGFMPVVYDENRAAQGLPPWTSTLDGQHFMDSEVAEATPTAVTHGR